MNATKHEREGMVLNGEDGSIAQGDVFEFRSQRGIAGNSAGTADDVPRRRALVEALDGMRAVEDRVDRIMTDVLDTGGSWHMNGAGEIPPRAALVEIQVHGIRALGCDVGQAIANWIAAARRGIEGQGNDL